MSGVVWARLRQARYALPQLAGNLVSAKTAHSAARTCATLRDRGFAVTAGHFPGENEPVDAVLAANLAMLDEGASAGNFYLSIKAPQLAFQLEPINAIANAAKQAGASILFDAHGPALADRTFALLGKVLTRHPGTGCVLPARWSRSLADAERLRSSTARIRVVKGEWADGSIAQSAHSEAYLELVGGLAGRAAPVAVATHDPILAGRALSLLLAAGTPCELEQLRGLPMRRTSAVAKALGVPVRVYVPFGAGWIPYATNQALARPHLPLWMLRDRLGLTG